jgi:hypothetical protein
MDFNPRNGCLSPEAIPCPDYLAVAQGPSSSAVCQKRQKRDAPTDFQLKKLRTNALLTDAPDSP